MQPNSMTQRSVMYGTVLRVNDSR